jgi:hypothetical protein
VGVGGFGLRWQNPVGWWHRFGLDGGEEVGRGCHVKAVSAFVPHSLLR